MNDYIYVVFIRSNTKAGSVIRKLTGWKYSHVSICFDENKDEFYAFSRLNYKSSFWAGYTKEYKSNYTLLKDKDAELTYYKIPITKEEKKNILTFIKTIEEDKEYIFNYPSMLTTTIVHGFELYKSFNCITFVSKILEFISSIKMTKKYYKYDLNELEQDVIEYYYKKETIHITTLNKENKFFDKINYKSRKREEFKLFNECVYRLFKKKSSKRYNDNFYSNKIKDQSTKVFDRLASTYDKSFSGYNPRKNYNNIIDMINLKKVSRILDVGCGTGEILNILSKQNKKYELYGVDISKKMIEVAVKKDKAKKIKYICCDSENIPLKDNYFDLIITSESFHHYPNPNNVLKEFKRVLKANGRIILCDMYRPYIIRKIMNFMFYFTNTGDVKMYSTKEMSKMLEYNNYKIISFKKYYHSFIYEIKNNKDKL